MNLSLCCISLMLQEQGHKFQTMTYTRFNSLPRKEAIGILSSRILNNFVVTHKIINHCHNMGIRGYRMSSSIMPLLTHPEVNLNLSDLPDATAIYREIERLSKRIYDIEIRISAHPGEYTTLTSDKISAVDNSIRDLECHGMLFDLLKLPKSYVCPLNIHIRQDGNPIELSNKFMRNFDKLSDSVKQRLVLENNDNVGGTWHIKNLITHFNEYYNIPITFDTLHHKFCHGDMSEQDAFDAAYKTWGKVIPLFHFSEGIANTRKHADYANTIPNNYGKHVFWDVELKAKDYAIKKIFEALKQ